MSLNTVAVRLGLEVGPKTVVQTAQRLGIASKLEANASIALGTSEVTPLELVTAYAPFANGGIGVLPYVIRLVKTSSGETVYSRTGTGLGRVVDPQIVGMMNAMMRETLLTGTARKAELPGWEAAGKTGTSQDWRDAWFVGYTGTLLTGVWLGNDDDPHQEGVRKHASCGGLEQIHEGGPCGPAAVAFAWWPVETALASTGRRPKLHPCAADQRCWSGDLVKRCGAAPARARPEGYGQWSDRARAAGLDCTGYAEPILFASAHVPGPAAVDTSQGWERRWCAASSRHGAEREQFISACASSCAEKRRIAGSALRRLMPATLAEAVERSSVPLQPGLGVIRALTKLVDDPPEFRRMVHLLEMRHFMRSEIVQHVGRREDQPPGEVESPGCRA